MFFTNWRSRKASGISWRCERQRVSSVDFHPNTKTWELGISRARDGCLSSVVEGSGERENEYECEWVHILLHSAFYSIWALMDQMMITCAGEGRSFVLSLQIQMLISFGNTFPDTLRINVSPNIWASCSPVKSTQTLAIIGGEEEIEWLSRMGGFIAEIWLRDQE